MLKSNKTNLRWVSVVISDDNAQLIEEANMKYISALDPNQIVYFGID